MILCTFTWSGDAWGIDWKNDWSSAPSLNSSFYLYNVDNNVFAKSGGSGSSAVTSAASATYWTYKNVQSSYKIFGKTYYTDHYSIISPDNYLIHFDHNSGDYDAKTNETSPSGNTEVLYAISDGKFQIRSQVSGIQQYFLFVSNSKLRVKYVAGSSNDYYQWYLINQIQYNNHLAIEAYETANNTVTTTYSSSNLPNTFYNQVTSYLNSTTGYLSYNSWLSSTDKSSSIRSATTSINNWLSTAAEMKTAYANALNTIATAKSNNTANNPANIASSDITDAETALEAATTTTAIANALAKIKNFDAITINVPETVEMGSSVSNSATVTSGRSLTYTSSDNTVLSFSGSTVNAIKQGEVTITVTTGSTGNNSSGKTYYHCTATKTVKVLPVFYFTVTPVKIYDHGMVEATITGKVVGTTPDVESASEQATFIATSNTGCTFLGWYYDEAHTQLASTDATYKPMITNDSAGSTENLTLYAWFKSPQTLTWTNATFDKNIIVGSTAAGAAKATASSGLTVAYSSSNSSIASVNTNGDVKGELPSNNDVTITASQAGNDEYYAATSITRDFHVISKSQATFTVSGFTGTDPTIYVGDTPTITIANTASDFTYTSSDETVVGIEKDGNVITLTALKVGTSTITLDQPENSTHSHVPATYNITVSKVANTLGVTLAAASNVQVDGTVNVSFTGINSDADIIAAITDTLSSTVNNGEHVISYSNGVITAQNAGVAWITFSQAPTNRYEGFTSIRYKVAVTKHSNPITITLAGGSSTNIKLKYNATATLAYSSAHSTSSISVSRTSGSHSTYANGTITAGTAQGTDIYAITQDETYKYEAGYASFTIRVNNTDEAVGYVLYDLSEYHHGAGEGTIHKYDLSGPGNVVSYKAWRWPLAIYYDFYVQYSVTGNDNDWHELENNHNVDDSGEPSQDHTCPDTIPEDARYLRFYLPAGGTSRKLVKDVKVTRKTYLRASSNKTSFGTVYTDENPNPTATITVNYSSVNGGDINISSNNSNFVPSVSKLDVEVNKKDPTNTYVSGVDGTQTFTVTYNPNPNSLGDETAVITISDLFNTKQITLTATAAKHENTLAVIGAQDLMVDDEVSNVYSSKNSTASLNYTLSRDGVITYNPSTNKIKAVGEGNVTLTLSQAENDYYFGASKTITVNVSKYNQTLSWDNELDAAARTLEVGDHLLTNTATATSGLSVTYSSSNASALEVNASTGELIAKAGGSNIAITATQAGNYKYNEAVSITRYFTVISRIDAVVATTLLEGVSNNFPMGNPDITIGCNATITESALTITGNEDGIVSSSFADNTFTIRALKEGTVTLTLTRAQDEGYNALNKSYTIQVVKPVVVLEPTVTPVFNYEEYSSVILNSTLKSGYSTIALPFNTTVEDIVGDDYDSTTDWVAQLSVVTYNAKDGYSLYFEKKSDIVANQPYILHLGSAVDTPVFNNISVVAAATASQYTTKGVKDAIQWVLHSNYNPTFDMEGYYGVVGEKIKKGTEGSSLKAFHAYIEGPAAAGVKAAYLDDDEADGLLEVMREEVLGAECVYDLQGRQLPKAGKGINIIRSADGSIKKILKK